MSGSVHGAISISHWRYVIVGIDININVVQHGTEFYVRYKSGVARVGVRQVCSWVSKMTARQKLPT